MTRNGSRHRALANHQERFLTVAQVAKQAGVGAPVVRFYARSGLIRASRVAANGYRQFVPLDVKRVRFVRAAQGLGFTLSEIREVMRRSHHGKSPCPIVRDIIVRRFAENKERLGLLLALQKRMGGAIEHWKDMPDEIPTGDVICALIEAVGDHIAPEEARRTVRLVRP